MVRESPYDAGNDRITRPDQEFDVYPGNILVAEADPGSPSSLCGIVTASGIELAGACSTGEETVAAALAVRPGLLLVDIQLAGPLNGVDAVRRIREEADLPVVFETAPIDETLLQQALACGPYGILSKPFRADDVQSALRVAGRRLAVEAGLKEREAKFRTLFETTKDAVMMLDERGFFDCNPATLTIFGLPNKEDFVKSHPATLSPPFQPDGRDSMTAALAHIRIAMETGADSFEWVHRRGTGEDYMAHVLLSAFDLHGRRVLQATVRDISERVEHERRLERVNEELREANRRLKESQSMLLQQEKLASIGQLAAGVAHELNNPIGFVSSNLSSLQQYSEVLVAYVRKLEEALQAQPASDLAESRKSEAQAFRQAKKIGFMLEDMKDLMAESRQGLERVTTIVRNLRCFSRVDFDEVFTPYDIREGVENTLVVAQNEVKYVADVEKDLGEVPLVSCIGSEINQVILNVLVNAAQAMREQQPSGRGKIAIRTWHDDRWVYLRVADSGPGISPDVIGRIFDPFFTTKEVGKGTGLGLSISHNIIVEKHRGRFEVESRPGEGAAFTIALPLAAAAGPAAGA